MPEVVITTREGRQLRCNDGVLSGAQHLVDFVTRAEADGMEVDVTPTGPLDRVKATNVRTVIALLNKFAGPVTSEGDPGPWPYDDPILGEDQVF